MSESTYLSYVGCREDKVGYNGIIYSWSAFVAMCPIEVASISIADFYIDNYDTFKKYLKRIEFIWNNVKIVPGHTTDEPFPQLSLGKICSSNKPYVGSVVRGPWETDDSPEIDIKMLETRDAIRKNTVAWQTPRPSVPLPVIVVPKTDIPKFVASEERWTCPNCNMEWPMNAVEQSWRDNNNCAGCA